MPTPTICSALGLKNVNFPSALATNTPSLILLKMVSMSLAWSCCWAIVRSNAASVRLIIVMSRQTRTPPFKLLLFPAEVCR